MWATDHVAEGWESWFRPPVFTADELDAIARVDCMLHAVSDSFSNLMPSLTELIGTYRWERLRQVAEESLKVFQHRGRFSEEEEERFSDDADRRGG